MKSQFLSSGSRFCPQSDVAPASYRIHSSFIRKLRSVHSKAWEVITPVVTTKKLSKFDTKTLLSTIDGGRKIAAFPKKQVIFAQGDSSDAVSYIQKGKAKLTVVSKSGKEATIGILNDGDFFGEGCLIGQPVLRNRNDRLLCNVNRQEVHDGSASPGTRLFRYVRSIPAN